METKITYENHEQSLWDFSGLQLSIQNAVDQMSASFSEGEKRKKVNKWLEAIADLEGDLIQSVSKTNSKDSVKKFFNSKTFGTFEQMRVEMELRYKAEQVFLTTADKFKL